MKQQPGVSHARTLEPHWGPHDLISGLPKLDLYQVPGITYTGMTYMVAFINSCVFVRVFHVEPFFLPRRHPVAGFILLEEMDRIYLHLENFGTSCFMFRFDSFFLLLLLLLSLLLLLARANSTTEYHGRYCDNDGEVSVCCMLCS